MEFLRLVLAVISIISSMCVYFWFMVCRFSPSWIYRLHAHFRLLSKADVIAFHTRIIMIIKNITLFIFLLPCIALHLYLIVK
ncbi:DUF6868 family protein [Thaumasiovibrio sp. DFM-14]|uniref:DUF6868 family protein n=1 Tax=Thaumasiovibrio sp. DFM-14 TaxID=3384792 RepID=UPI0039A12935